MTETDSNTEYLPDEITYGFVADRVLLAVGDTNHDFDRYPDGVPAQGTVRFSPERTVLYTQNKPATVLPQDIECTIYQGDPDDATEDPDQVGLLVDPAGHIGNVALIVGWYEVVYRLQAGTMQRFRIQVKPEHTKDNPLWLSAVAPVTPTPSERFVVNEQVYNDTKAARDETLQYRNEARAARTGAATSETNAAQSATQAHEDANRAETAAEVYRQVARIGANQVWDQSRTPPSGTTYEWAGQPHKSASIKKIDGEEISRNLVPNPSFEGPFDPATMYFANLNHGVLTWPPRVVAGDQCIVLTATENTSAFSYVYQRLELNGDHDNQYLGFHVKNLQAVGFQGGAHLRLAFHVNGQWEHTPLDDFILAPSSVGGAEGTRIARIPADRTSTEVRVMMYPRRANGDQGTAALPGDQFTTDAWVAAVGTGEEDILEKIVEYWDGDSRDDRAQDIWIDSDDVYHYWQKGTGWTELF